MFLYVEHHTINQTLIYSFFSLGNITPFSNLLHKHTEHPKSKVTDNLIIYQLKMEVQTMVYQNT